MCTRCRAQDATMCARCRAQDATMGDYTKAKENPQAAYTAYTLSMSNHWKYLQRITPTPTNALHTLDEEITTQFVTVWFIRCPTGAGHANCIRQLRKAYASFCLATAHLSAAIKGQEQFSLDTHTRLTNTTQVYNARLYRQEHDKRFEAELNYHPRSSVVSSDIASTRPQIG
eukprot:GHVR01067420.1.p1 GENE.GHVR01067420.1~~GHVR01067420.1.p1  ORF type:complete len:172 (+),score=18.66 GHVR01067420.1:1484-1999(+)